MLPNLLNFGTIFQACPSVRTITFSNVSSTSLTLRLAVLPQFSSQIKFFIEAPKPLSRSQTTVKRVSSDNSLMERKTEYTIDHPDEDSDSQSDEDILPITFEHITLDDLIKPSTIRLDQSFTNSSSSTSAFVHATKERKRQHDLQIAISSGRLIPTETVLLNENAETVVFALIELAKPEDLSIRRSHSKLINFETFVQIQLVAQGSSISQNSSIPVSSHASSDTSSSEVTLFPAETPFRKLGFLCLLFLFNYYLFLFL